MNSMFPTAGAEFLQLHSVRMLALVPGGSVIPVLAIFTSQNNDISHFFIPLRRTYSMIVPTTPLPMVCPPSRIAKRSPISMAMGVIR